MDHLCGDSVKNHLCGDRSPAWWFNDITCVVIDHLRGDGSPAWWFNDITCVVMWSPAWWYNDITCVVMDHLCGDQMTSPVWWWITCVVIKWHHLCGDGSPAWWFASCAVFLYNNIFLNCTMYNGIHVHVSLLITYRFSMSCLSGGLLRDLRLRSPCLRLWSRVRRLLGQCASQKIRRPVLSLRLTHRRRLLRVRRRRRRRRRRTKRPAVAVLAAGQPTSGSVLRRTRRTRKTRRKRKRKKKNRWDTKKRPELLQGRSLGHDSATSGACQASEWKNRVGKSHTRAGPTSRNKSVAIVGKKIAYNKSALDQHQKFSEYCLSWQNVFPNVKTGPAGTGRLATCAASGSENQAVPGESCSGRDWLRAEPRQERVSVQCPEPFCACCLGSSVCGVGSPREIQDAWGAARPQVPALDEQKTEKRKKSKKKSSSSSEEEKDKEKAKEAKGTDKWCSTSIITEPVRIIDSKTWHELTPCAWKRCMVRSLWSKGFKTNLVNKGMDPPQKNNLSPKIKKWFVVF